MSLRTSSSDQDRCWLYRSRSISEENFMISMRFWYMHRVLFMSDFPHFYSFYSCCDRVNIYLGLKLSWVTSKAHQLKKLLIVIVLIKILYSYFYLNYFYKYFTIIKKQFNFTIIIITLGKFWFVVKEFSVNISPWVVASHIQVMANHHLL
jgi:hypothetical protein